MLELWFLMGMFNIGFLAATDEESPDHWYEWLYPVILAPLVLGIIVGEIVKEGGKKDG